MKARMTFPAHAGRDHEVRALLGVLANLVAEMGAEAEIHEQEPGVPELVMFFASRDAWEVFEDAWLTDRRSNAILALLSDGRVRDEAARFELSAA